jgi:hypothetical protein
MVDTSENPFKESIEETVWEATAPRFEVRVQAAQNTGATTPVGGVEVRQRVPFHVLFTPAADYFFIRWAAYDASSMAEYGANVVLFASPEALETDVTIDASEGNFLIQPICVKRPTVMGRRPGIDVTNQPTNMPITVDFSTDMDENSFKYEGGSAIRDGKFKNISITGAPPGLDYEQADYTPYFEEPVLKGRQLIIRVKDAVPMGSKLYITMEKGIFFTYAERYQVTMADDYTWSYSVGSTKDAEPPYMTRLGFAESPTAAVPPHNVIMAPSATDPVAEISPRRFRGPVYLAFNAVDTIDLDQLSLVVIEAASVYNRDGGAAADPSSRKIYEGAYYFSDDIPSGVADTGQRLSVVPVDINGFEDGVIEFSFRFRDQTSNMNDSEKYPPYKYYIVKDTTPPYISGQDHIGVTGGSYQDLSLISWFQSSGTAQFSKNSAVIADLGKDEGGDVPPTPRTRSSDIYWTFSLKDTGNFAPWQNIGSGDFGLPITSVAGLADGALPVYVKLKDDLGNESSPVLLPDTATIHKDTNPPYIPGNGITITQGTGADRDKWNINIAALDDLSGTGTGANEYTVKVAGPGGNTFTGTMDGLLPTGGDNSGNITFTRPNTPTAGVNLVLNPNTIDTSSDSMFNRDHPPRSGVHTIAITVTDHIGNSNPVPYIYTFSHDTRRPVVIDLVTGNAVTDLVTSYTVINGTAGSQAFIRSPIGAPREFYINNRQFRIRARASDRNPDADGLGLRLAGFFGATKTGGGSPVYSLFEARRNVEGAYDGNSPIDLDWGGADLRFSDDTREAMRFNLFFTDVRGNYTYYPSVVDSGGGGLHGTLTGNTATGVNSISDPADDYLGPDNDSGGFFVYYDETPPDFDGSAPLTISPPDSYRTSIGTTPVVYLKNSTNEVGFSFTARDRKTAPVDKASGFKRWGYSNSSGGNITWWSDIDGDIDYSGQSDTEADHTGPVTESGSSLTLKNADAVPQLPASPTLANFSHPVLQLEDNAGNQSPEKSSIKYDGINEAEYFIIDSTAPSFNSLNIKNGSALNLKTLSGTPVLVTEGASDTAAALNSKDYADKVTDGTLTFTLNGVREYGVGIKEIRITTGGSFGLSGSSLTIAKNSSETGIIAALSGGGNTFTVTLPEPLRFAESAAGGTLEIRGLSFTGPGDGASIDSGKIIDVKLADWFGWDNALSHAPSNSLYYGGGTLPSSGSNLYTILDHSTAVHFDDPPGTVNHHTGGVVDIIVKNITAKSGLAMFGFSYPSSGVGAPSADILQHAGVYINGALKPKSEYYWIGENAGGTYTYFVRFKDVTPFLGTATDTLEIRNLRIPFTTGDTINNDVKAVIYDYFGGTGGSGRELFANGTNPFSLLLDNQAPQFSDKNPIPAVPVNGGDTGVKKYVSDTLSGSIKVKDAESGHYTRPLAYLFLVSPNEYTTASNLPETIKNLRSTGSSPGTWTAPPAWAPISVSDNTGSTISWLPGSGAVDASGIPSGKTLETLLSTTEAQYIYVLATDWTGNIAVEKIYGEKVFIDKTGPRLENPNLVNSEADQPADFTSGNVTYTVTLTEADSGLETLGFATGFASIGSVKVGGQVYTANPTDGQQGYYYKYDSGTGTLTFNGTLKPVGSNVTIEITSTLTGSDGVKKIQLSAAKDAVGKPASPLDTTEKTITLDTKGPEITDFRLPDGASGYAANTVEVMVTFTELHSGLKTLSFSPDFDFTPTKVSLSSGGTAIANSTVSGKTVILPANNTDLAGPGSKSVYVTGTLSDPDEQKTIRIIEATDSVGNNHHNSLPGDVSVTRDTIAPTVSAVTFNGKLYNDTDGTATLYITFTETLSGLKTITLGGNGTFTGSTPSAVEVKFGADGGSAVSESDYTYSAGVLTFTNQALIGTNLKGTVTIRIKGILPPEDGHKNVSVISAGDLAGNTKTSDLPGSVSITRDRTPVSFSGAELVNDVAGYASTTHSSGTVKYTLTVTEKGSGLKSLSLSGLSIAGYSAGYNTVTVNGTEAAYDETGTGSTITFTSLQQSDLPMIIVITGTLGSGEDEKTVQVTAAPDEVGNLPALTGTAKKIILDKTAPIVSNFEKVGSGYTQEKLTVKLTFTEASSGLKKLVFDDDDDFTPTKVSLTSDGTAITDSDVIGKTVTLPGNTTGTVYITGNLTGGDGNNKTVSLSSVIDRVGNEATGLPKTINSLVKDNILPVVSNAEFTGQDYNDTDGKATLYITFTEQHSGLKTITLGGDKFTGTAASDVEVKFGASNGSPVDIGKYTYNAGVLTFSDPDLITTEGSLKGSGLTIRIKGTLPGEGGDGLKTVTVTSAGDLAGNTTVPAGLPDSPATITRDRTPVSFGSVTLVNDVAGYASTTHSKGTVKYTLPVTESNTGSGLKSLTLSGLSIAGSGAITVDGTGVDYGWSGSTITFSTPQKSSSAMSVVITGTLGSGENEKTVQVTAALDVAGNTQTTLIGTVKKITRDETAPTGLDLNVEGSPYTQSTATVKLSFTEDSSGLKTLVFNSAFMPTKVSLTSEGGPIGSITGQTVTLSESQACTTGDVYITGTLSDGDGPKTVSLISVIDQVGNAASASDLLTASTSLVRDNTPPAISTVTFNGRLYNDVGGTATLYITFTEADSGLKTITLDGNGKFTGTNASDVEVYFEASSSTANPIDDYTYNNGVLTFTKESLITGSDLMGSGKIIRIKGTLPGGGESDDGLKNLSVISAGDLAGNTTTSGLPGPASITRDTTPVSFSGAELVNDVAGYDSTDYSSGTVKYTLTVTESRSGLSSLSLSGLSIPAYSAGTQKVMVGTTEPFYTGSGSTITFSIPQQSDLPMSIVITGELETGEDEKTVQVTAASDLVGNTQTMLTGTIKNITRDETAPTGLSLEVVAPAIAGGKHYTKDAVMVKLTFTEASSGLKTLTFGGDFTPDGVKNSGSTPIDGVVGFNNKTVTLPANNSDLIGTNQIVYITGTLDDGDGDNKTVSLSSVIDQVGNEATGFPSAITSLVKDNEAPSISSMGFTDAYTSGTAVLHIAFTEQAGLKSLTFDTTKDFFATVTGVMKGGSSVDHSYNSGTGVLEFTNRTQTMGMGTLEITGTATGGEGLNYVSLSAAEDYLGNETIPTDLPSETSITLDATAPVFGTATLVNDVAGYDSTTHSSGTVKYTLLVTESGSGLSSLSLSGLSIAGYVGGGANTVTVDGTEVDYTGSGSTITFSDPQPSDSSMSIAITGTLVGVEGSSITVEVTAAPDVVGNTPDLTGTVKTITLDTTGPSALSLDKVGNGYTQSAAIVKLTFTEGSSGLKTLIFDGDFTPDAVSLSSTGTPVIVGASVDGPTKTVTLPGDTTNLAGTNKIVYITGTLDGGEGPNTVSLSSVRDRVGNAGSLPGGITLVKDNIAPTDISAIVKGSMTDALDDYTHSQTGNTLTITATDNSLHAYAITTVNSQPDSGDWVTTGITGTGPWTAGTVDLKQTANPVVYLWLQDKAGNATSSGTSVSFNYEPDVPSITITDFTVKGPKDEAQDGFTDSQTGNRVTVTLGAGRTIAAYGFSTASGTVPTWVTTGINDGGSNVWSIPDADIGIVASGDVYLWLRSRAGRPMTAGVLKAIIYDSTDPTAAKSSLTVTGTTSLTITGFAFFDANVITEDDVETYSGSIGSGTKVDDATYDLVSTSTTDYTSSVTIPNPFGGASGNYPYYITVTDKAGRSSTVTFALTWNGTDPTIDVTSPSFGFIPGAFIDDVSEFAGNTVRRVRSGLSAVAAALSGGSGRPASTTTELASLPSPRIDYQSSRERAEAARSPAVESTLNSGRTTTGDSSAGRIAGADLAPRETEMTNRAPEREGTVNTRPEKALAGNGETGELEAASLLNNGGLVPTALEADQDAGMKGAAFFLAAFALLAAAAVFFTVRVRTRVKKSKDDAGE